MPLKYITTTVTVEVHENSIPEHDPMMKGMASHTFTLPIGADAGMNHNALVNVCAQMAIQDAIKKGLIPDPNATTGKPAPTTE